MCSLFLKYFGIFSNIQLSSFHYCIRPPGAPLFNSDLYETLEENPGPHLSLNVLNISGGGLYVKSDDNCVEGGGHYGDCGGLYVNCDGHTVYTFK